MGSDLELHRAMFAQSYVTAIVSTARRPSSCLQDADQTDMRGYRQIPSRVIIGWSIGIRIDEL